MLTKILVDPVNLLIIMDLNKFITTYFIDYQLFNIVFNGLMLLYLHLKCN